MPYLVAPAIPAGALAATGQPTLPVAAEALLRPWLLTDAEAVREAFRDPAIQRWHLRRADSVAEARGWIEAWQSEWRSETGAHWALVDAESGGLLGRVALKSFALTDGTAEIAYWTVPSARGRGLCPRAVTVLAQWALYERGFHRIDLEHAMANHASCRVAAKAGFEAEGIRRRAWLHADGRHDVHLHARVRQD
ncbi:GNAT family N-acetyltransferase [Streptomyces sp. NBC_01260]|uniref:GNAT family N-acetyltransferase n=1 Tax=unclassified Streptomyces TaxID=2593676 RepID=UPI000F4AD6C9|nr:MULTISPECIES: GNAT family N-acetyltransferase [unclassified Streptomyces]ROQ71682.1 RimJ/RimL family protein N-acetyltransferase [Streptomyces sp. CEV 2-1]